MGITFQTLEQFLAREIRQPQVQEDEIGAVLGFQEGSACFPGLDRNVAGAPQAAGHVSRRQAIVFDNQDQSQGHPH